MRVLVAWELGGNWGHLGRLLPVARALRARGEEVVFAVASPEDCEGRLGEEGFECLRTPRLRRRSAGVSPPDSFADILAACGFDDADAMDVVVREWCELFERERADAMLIDHAPSALFAARFKGLRAVQLSSGFELPPGTSPLLPFRAPEPAEVARLRAREARIVVALNAVADGFGAPPLSSVAQLFQGTPALLATFPELDHYGARKGARYIGPLFEAESGMVPDWPAGDGPRVFAYLRDAPWLGAFLDALASTGWPSICAIPGASQAMLDRHARGSVRIVLEPVGYLQLDPLPDFAVNYASHGTTSALLLAGIPVLMMPVHVEQLLLAHRVAALGAGLGAMPGAGEAGHLEVLRTMRRTESCAAVARSFSTRYAGHRVEEAAASAADALRRGG